MENMIKKYSNNEITVVWKPDLCTHSRLCWKELPEVFDPKKRPWVNIQGSSTNKIVEQIKKCPSGALTYYTNDKKDEIMNDKKENPYVEADVIHNGPVIVKTSVSVRQAGKDELKIEKMAAFCRCSKSKRQPFCDGSHIQHPFE
jgi:uncharacterized Fe-S cluster protein YjdI